MKNPIIHKQTIETQTYSKIAELTGDNFEEVKFYINNLLNYYHTQGIYDGRMKLQRELLTFLSDGNNDQVNND